MVALLSVTALPVFAQNEAVTDPVGFIDLTVTGGSPSTPRLSLVSPTLTQPILWQGLVTGVSGTTITVGGTPWGSNMFNGAAGSHYLELIAATNAALTGKLTDIVGTGVSTVTVSPSIPVAIGDTIKIRKDVTISDLLGSNNSAGLLASDDGSTADEVLIYSGSNAVSYFYYTGDPSLPAGWLKTDDYTPAGDVSIAPHEAVVIKRRGAGNLNVSFTGAVKTGNTLFPILSGFNVLGTASAKGLTLAESNLYTGNSTTGVLAADDGSVADEVFLYGSNGVGVSYFYYSDGPGWVKTDDYTDASNVPIAPGTAFVLKRKSGAPFNWSLPSPTSF